MWYAIPAQERLPRRLPKGSSGLKTRVNHAVWSTGRAGIDKHTGANGAAGRVTLKQKRELQGKGCQHIPAGDRLIINTPGGGGFGAAPQRDWQLVRRDLANGMISREAAVGEYALTDG